MQKNDYRRAVIMLRPMISGYSGHARLEQRTLLGDLYITVLSPGDALDMHAVLAGQKRGNWYAMDIGELRRDNRGQAALRYHYDPRNVGGRDMDDYALLLIALPQRGGEIALSGNLKGCADVNWLLVQSAVQGLFRPRESAMDLPEADAVPEAENSQSREETLPKLQEEIQEEAKAPESPQTREEEERPEDPPAQEEEAQSDQPKVEFFFSTEETSPESEGAPEDACPESCEEERDEEEEEEEKEEEEKEEEEQTGRDSSENGWEDARERVEPGQDDQSGSPKAEKGERDLVLPEYEGYTFVPVSVPKGCGYPYAAIGLASEDDRVVGVCYALPARKTAEPPEGLEDYSWLGDGNIGWWIDCLDIQ